MVSIAVTNGYCTVEDVRSQLTDTGSKLDTARIERAINATSRAIDRYCGRRFWKDQAPTARLYALPDRHHLDVADISTMTGLVVETDLSASGTWTVMASTDYHLEPLNADANGGAFAWWTVVFDSGWLFHHRHRWYLSSRPAVRVTAQWGWSDVPDQVVSATILKAVSLFMRKDAPFGVAGFTEFGPVRITKRDPDVLDLLAPFILAAVA